jgi:pyruvate/2-oxoglutarate dehydrogenase complex dihydrolipoamide dehydrogenase (E3) component
VVGCSVPVDQENFLCRVRPPNWQNPKAQELYDLIVVGGGPAGLAAAEFARRQGRSVALIERDHLGGNSLNSGSIPSKAIIRAARVFAFIRDGADFGTTAPNGPIDFAAVMARMRRIRTRIAEYHSADRLSARGIDVFFCSARFEGPNTVRAGETRLSFKKAIVATGARPQASDIPGLEEIGYLTSDSIFGLNELPPRLGVIGGGPLGCELAQAFFCRLGSRVTIVQNEPKFLPLEERDAAELLSMSMSRDGVETRLNTTVVGARMEGGAKLLDTVNDDLKFSITVDEVILSIGRAPNVGDLGLESAGIDFDAVRGIDVDDFLRTSNADVYAAGDVSSAHPFTNIAEASARLAVQNAFGARMQRQSRLTIPWCTYCDPEIAHIGLHLREARRQSIPVKCFTVMMQDVDRAITDEQDDGFVKIYVREGTNRILGASIVASRASELINEMSVIMSAGIGMRKLATILHTYPAQSDAIRLAAVAYMNDQPVDGTRRD